MRKTVIFLFSLLMILISADIEAQKTYKVVCDKSDNKIKIVDGDDRSPNMVPLKGGFPFIQVAQKWVKENYPDESCDAAAAINQNQAVTTGQPAATNNNPADFFKPTPTASVPVSPVFKYRNTSVSLSLLFSDLGKVYNLDPPLVPGINIGIEYLIGTKFYGGTGLHLNSLIGKTADEAGVGAFYNIQVPLFAGYRQYTGKNHWKVELGVSANTKLRPASGDMDLGGEIPAGQSVSALTRVKAGKDKYEFVFGVDMWLTDILSTEEGYQLTVLSLGLQYCF